jgi:pimeloyl-ACP methyl ester carboxylesterase
MRKFFRIVVLSIVFIIVFILLLFIVERNKKITLPAPTGEFAIGRTWFEWTDTSRLDTLAPKPDKPRELFLWVWYPAVKQANASTGDYLPESWRKAIATRQGIFARFFTRKLSKIKSYAGDSLPPVANKQFPVVLIKSGIGSLTSDYTTFAEDLASNGYIVIGSESPFSTSVIVYSDGRVVTDNAKGNPGNAAPSVDRDRRLDRLVSLWTDDLEHIVTRLEQINVNDSSNLLYHRMNLKQIGVFGHALGGATAFRFCFTDPRCKAGVTLNGTPFGNVNENKLSKPFMFLMADPKGVPADVRKQVSSNIDTIYQQLPLSRQWLKLTGAYHYNFSDQAVIRERFFARRNDDLGTIGELRGLEVTAATLRTFFDVNLKGAPPKRISELKTKYFEIDEAGK